MTSTKPSLRSHVDFEDSTDLGHIPGDLGYPLIGRLPAMLKSVTGLAQDQYTRFGPVSRFSVALSHKIGCTCTHNDASVGNIRLLACSIETGLSFPTAAIDRKVSLHSVTGA